MSIRGLTMSNLNNTFEAAKRKGVNYIGVTTQFEDSPAEEIIIIPKENFDRKWMYYQDVYDENLRHRTFRGTFITGMTYGNNFKSIEADLIG